MIKGKPTLDQIFDMRTDVEHAETSERASPLDLTTEGRKLYRLIEQNLVATALPSKEVLIRPLEVKLTKLRDVDAVLAFQAEPILPYAAEEALLDRIVLGKNQEATRLTLCATKKEFLENQLEVWRSLHIEPEVVTCAPAALAAFARHFFPSETPYFVLHMGMLETVCLLIKGNKLIAAHHSQTHFSKLLDALLIDKPVEKENVSLLIEEISDENTPIAAKLVRDWQLEITKIFFSLAKQTQEEIPALLITGSGGRYPTLTSALCTKLPQAPHTPQPTPEFPVTVEQLQKYAIPLGMALSTLPGFPDPINFRQEELAYPNPWKRLKQPLLAYFAAILFLSAAFYLYGAAHLKHKEDQLKQQFVSLVAFMHKPYAEFEQEYARKFPNEAENPAVLTKDVKSMTQEGLKNRITQVEKFLQSLPESFPLQPNIPQVTDVLAWLKTHPKTTQVNEQTGEVTPLIEIESFNYTVVKRPEKSRPNDRYQIKVDMEFTSPSPKAAREFHDALIAPNDFVDPKNEVKWSASQGKYRTSFFLRDKTIYPSQKG